jgi:hypothetical protein
MAGFSRVDPPAVRRPPQNVERSTVFVCALVALAASGFAWPWREESAPLPVMRARSTTGLVANASLNAFGNSRGVRLRFALPSLEVEFPIEVSGDPSELTYEWRRLRDTSTATFPRPIDGATLLAPNQPGFYQLVIIKGTQKRVVAEPALAVMVPFTDKVGVSLNGYRIGTYLGERLTEDHERPSGFVEVGPDDVNLMVSTHIRLGDFITHYGQESVWPKYVALNPRLLDKLELVLGQIGGRAVVRLDSAEAHEVAFDVHSGFRTPAHNRSVPLAARDSRHQYGDAADVAIDADGDGRITLKDQVLVVQAVDQVEDTHPELVGGLGIYVSRRYLAPYVHIDVRGNRTRWKG